MLMLYDSRYINVNPNININTNANMSMNDIAFNFSSFLRRDSDVALVKEGLDWSMLAFSERCPS